VPQHKVACGSKKSDGANCKRLGGVGNEQDPSAWQSITDRATHYQQEQARDRTGERNHAQCYRRRRKLKRLPDQCDGEQPVADQRDGLAGPEEPEVSFP
jgi:hypothetical protein